MEVLPPYTPLSAPRTFTACNKREVILKLSDEDPTSRNNEFSLFPTKMVCKTYSDHTIVPLARPKAKLPEELEARGITVADWEAVRAIVKATKTLNNRNKVYLWGCMTLALGLGGLLLSYLRACGNQPLRHKLSNILEQYNIMLAVRDIDVRFTWIDGRLYAYYS